MTFFTRLITVILMTMSSSLCLANLTVGQAISLPQLEDQFEQPHALQASTNWLLFAHDMESTNIVREALKGQTTDSLNKAGIQFVADISGMPGLISKFVAMPRLRKLDYSIGLAKEQALLLSIPRTDDMATVMELNEGEIESITTVDNSETIKNLLAL